MTPLAQRVMRETEIRRSKRSFNDQAGVARLMDDIHCFEVSAVWRLACDTFAPQWKPEASETLAFLPAPRTWIEVDFRGNTNFKGFTRMAWHLTAPQEEDVCEMRIVAEFGPAATPGRPEIGSLEHVFLFGLRSLARSGTYVPFGDKAAAWDDLFHDASGISPASMVPLMYVFLAMINSPRVIGRTTHMPHAGFQRELAHARGMVGKFPLRAWTEITLEVRPPQLERGDKEIRLSGARAFHFCRAYLRIQNGKIVFVSAYWAGDAALGIVQSRYRVVLPKAGKPRGDAR